MKLSTKGRYGVRAIVDLAIHGKSTPVSIKSISKRQNISEYYLEHLFTQLRNANLIKSIRGAQGGYILNKNPKEIIVSDVLDVLEGPIKISKCIEEGLCSNSNCCATRLLWVKIKESIDNITKLTTLQDIIDDYENMKFKGENTHE